MSVFFRKIAYSLFILALLVPVNVFASAALENPLTGKTRALSLAESVGLIVRGLLGFAGVLAVIFVVIGGVRIIAAAGNEEQIKQGKQTLLWAVLGLVVAFGGYVIVNAVVENADKFFSA